MIEDTRDHREDMIQKGDVFGFVHQLMPRRFQGQAAGVDLFAQFPEIIGGQGRHDHETGGPFYLRI